MMESGIHSSAEGQDAPPPSAARKPAGGWKAIKYILGNESFEKLASMSLIANLTVYLSRKYNISGIFLVNVVTLWSGSSNIASLAGAFISDTFLGRFRTLLFGSIASLLGMGTMALTATLHQLRPPPCSDELHCPKPKNWQLGILFTSLSLLSIGAGGIRPCNIAFGADQFDTTTEKGRAQLESFFNWWYFSFTISLTVALTAVVYIQTNISWPIGFFIPTVCLFCSIAIFLLGQSTYIRNKPHSSIFSDMARVFYAACRNCNLKVSEHSLHDPPENVNKVNSQFVRLSHTNRFKFFDKAALISNPSGQLDNEGRAKDRWRLCSLQQVENFKCLVAVLPVWLSGICCFMTMDQTTTFGVLQSMQMNRHIGPHFEFPPGWMTIISMIAVSTWIYSYEQLYVARAKKLTGADKRLTIRQRIGIGIIMSILSMLVAGIVEKHRRDSSLKHRSFTSPTSFALLLPQFVLSGLTEAFAAVALMEFFTKEMPESMRTVAGALFFLTLSAASYLGSLIVNIINKVTMKLATSPWLGGHNLNDNRLENYYFIVAAFAAINFVYFNFYACKYVVSNNNGGSLVGEVQLQDEVKETGVEQL